MGDAAEDFGLNFGEGRSWAWERAALIPDIPDIRLFWSRTSGS